MDMKKAAEIVVMGSMLAVSMAATAGGVTATTKAQTAVVNTGTYVLESFTLNVSANVGMNWDDTDPQAVAVTSANTKGMHTFGGTSNGGSVKQCESTSVTSPTPGTPDLTKGCP